MGIDELAIPTHAFFFVNIKWEKQVLQQYEIYCYKN